MTLLGRYGSRLTRLLSTYARLGSFSVYDSYYRLQNVNIVNSHGKLASEWRVGNLRIVHCQADVHRRRVLCETRQYSCTVTVRTVSSKLHLPKGIPLALHIPLSI